MDFKTQVVGNFQKITTVEVKTKSWSQRAYSYTVYVYLYVAVWTTQTQVHKQLAHCMREVESWGLRSC